MSNIRHKTDWDYVEWLLDELSAQISPKINMVKSKREMVKSKREKQRLATAKSRENDPDAARKHREYMLRYNKKRNHEIKKRRAELRLAELEQEEGGTE